MFCMHATGAQIGTNKLVAHTAGLVLKYFTRPAGLARLQVSFKDWNSI